MSEIVTQAEEHARRRRERAWAGTFAEYWDLVSRTPALARSAAERAYEAVISGGVLLRPDGRARYRFFSEILFGVDATIERVVSYLQAGGRGFETRRRVLLLVGPPGCGKSTLVNRLKEGIEGYAATDAGALYTIDGCPLREEPLHLIPPELRPAVREQFGISVEGDLCPRCRYVLDTEFEGRVSAMPVRRVELSRTQGIGFGSYVATAPHAQDPEIMIGSTDRALLTQDRRRNAALAFRYDGQLFAANRGLMEFIDPFKLDERFLDVLNVVSEERRVPTERFGSVDVDMVLVAHTNLAEYQRFVQAQETAALQDRFVVVRMPYTLEISAEEAIYRKLTAPADFAGAAVAPLAMRIAATWAVLTRLAPSYLRLDPVIKARLYDGEGLPGLPFDAAERERRAAPDEGWEGVGPRYVVNRLAAVAASGGKSCVDAGDVLRSLWSGLGEHPRLAARDREEWVALFNSLRDEHDRLVQREVQRAALDDYLPRRHQAVEDYLAAAADWVSAGAPSRTQRIPALDRLEDRLRLPISERLRVRRGLVEATDRAACERWLEAAVDVDLLPSWPVLAERIVREPYFLERIGLRLESTFGYDGRCVESLLASARDLARGPRWSRILWPWSTGGRAP